MTDTYSVWYFSNKALGSISECEGSGLSFEEACKWFKHHTTNVCANVGFTERVMICDSGDCIVAEWKFGQGIVWPNYKEPIE